LLELGALEIPFYGSTYAAVIAKTSARFALVNPIKQTDTSTLKIAMIPSRADIDCTRYRTAIDATGIRDARIPVIEYVIRYTVVS
jgi:hypothetical protein